MSSLLVGNSLRFATPSETGTRRLSKPSLPLLEHEPQSKVVPAPKTWCGKYCIAPSDYSSQVVGARALKSKWLQNRLASKPGELLVQRTVSLPFGCLREMMCHHHENQAVNSIVSNRLKVAAELSSDADKLEWAHELRFCRDAVQRLKMPELMQDDLLQAMFKEQMTMPTHRDDWELFRRDMAGAFAQLFSPAVIRSLPSGPMESPVSLLVKDIGQREYDFTMDINSQGDVSGEVRLPHSTSRGFRFATICSSATPSTVQLPLPGYGRSHDTTAVVLDGIELPQSLALHHAEAKGMMDPPKAGGWEGDNMMLLPCYKEQVYKKLVHAAQGAVTAFEGDFAVDSIHLTGYISPNLVVFVQDLHVVQRDCPLLESSEWHTTSISP